MIFELEVHSGVGDHAIRAVAHATLDDFVIDAEIHELEGDGFGSFGEQVQLDVVVFGRRA